jgi:hypothetical protein
MKIMSFLYGTPVNRKAAMDNGWKKGSGDDILLSDQIGKIMNFSNSL